MGKTRKLEFDILKGISILLVIIGHSRCVSPIYEFFYSFHVPLFFCISGYFFSLKKAVWGVFSKCSRQLLLPYVLVSVITASLWVLFKGNSESYINNAVWGTTVPNDEEIGLGPSWFFLALFFCRIFYRFIAENISDIRWRTILIVMISGSIVMINKITPIYSLPYQITQGAVSLFYYHVGHLLTTSEKTIWSEAYKKWRTLIIPISIVFFLFCLVFFKWSHTCMNLSALDFPCFPLDFVNAVLLSFSTYVIVVKCLRNHYHKKLGTFLSWIGEGSIVVYFIHCLEYHFTIHPIAELVDNTFGGGNVVLYSMMRFVNPIVEISICLIGLLLYQMMKVQIKIKLSKK